MHAQPSTSPSIPTNTNELKTFAQSLLGQLEERDELLAQCDRELAVRTAELESATTLTEKLKFELARYRHWRFGKKCESIGAEQIALWEAELDADIEALQQRLDALQEEIGTKRSSEKRTPKREPLPATLPRIEERLEPESTICCDVPMTRIGEDVAQTLEMIPSRFWVKRRIRSKWACRCCERIAMAPVSGAAIDKAIAGTSVLANVIVSKYLDHQPLHRQEQIYRRMGVAIARSTMAGWIGRIGVGLEPLTDRLAEHMMKATALQADETPVPMLDPGSGKTATGYLWAYRTLPGDTLQAAVFDFATSRAQQHPNRMLAGFAGTLQVDGYAGYNEVLSRKNVIEVGCWAHARRKFVEVFDATKSPVAKEAIRRIAALYEIEHEIDCLNGATDAKASTLERQRERQTRAGPLLERPTSACLTRRQRNKSPYAPNLDRCHYRLCASHICSR